jgi:hypothetical protein
MIAFGVITSLFSVLLVIAVELPYWQFLGFF